MRGGVLLLSIAVLGGCESRAAVERTQTRLREADLPRVQALIEQDLQSHQAGVVKAARKLAPGFVVSDPSARESQVRAALKILQQPKKGIDEFVASPMSFLAAIGRDGVVIARDREPDRMAGEDYRSRFEVVQPGPRRHGRDRPRRVLRERSQSAVLVVDPLCSAILSRRRGGRRGAGRHSAVADGAAVEPPVPR